MYKILFIIMSLIVFWGCKNSSNFKSKDSQIQQNFKITESDPFPENFVNESEQKFNVQNYILNVGLKVIWPTIRDYHAAIQQLTFNLDLLISAIPKNDLLEINQLKAQIHADYKKSFLLQQKVIVLNLGPITWLEQGLTMKDRISSWPLLNHCALDSKIAKGQFDSYNLSINSTSFEVLDYLLFASTDKVTCNRKAHPHVVPWLTKNQNSKYLERLKMAQIVLAGQLQAARDLEVSWNPNKYNYTKKMIWNKSEPELIRELNQISDALFFIEKIKDIYLGLPIGKNEKVCQGEGCFNHRIARDSQMFESVLVSQVEIIHKLFAGSEYKSNSNLNSFYWGIGEFLKNSGHQSLFDNMHSDLISLNSHLKTALQNEGAGFDFSKCYKMPSQEPLCQAYDAVVLFNRQLKTDFLLVLSLRRPPVYQGDND